MLTVMTNSQPEPDMQRIQTSTEAHSRHGFFAQAGAVLRAAVPHRLQATSLDGLEVSDSTWAEWEAAMAQSPTLSWPGR